MGLLLAAQAIRMVELLAKAAATFHNSSPASSLLPETNQISEMSNSRNE